MGLARMLLGQLKNAMSFAKLQQLQWAKDLSDGTRIVVSSVFGQDEVRIEKPIFVPVVEQLPKIMERTHSDLLLLRETSSLWAIADMIAYSNADPGGGIYVDNFDSATGKFDLLFADEDFSFYGLYLAVGPNTYAVLGYPISTGDPVLRIYDKQGKKIGEADLNFLDYPFFVLECAWHYASGAYIITSDELFYDEVWFGEEAGFVLVDESASILGTLHADTYHLGGVATDHATKKTYVIAAGDRISFIGGFPAPANCGVYLSDVTSDINAPCPGIGEIHDDYYAYNSMRGVLVDNEKVYASMAPTTGRNSRILDSAGGVVWEDGSSNDIAFRCAHDGYFYSTRSLNIAGRRIACSLFKLDPRTGLEQINNYNDGRLTLYANIVVDPYQPYIDEIA